MKQVHTLPSFYSVFFYGRWSKEPEYPIETFLQFLRSCSSSVEYTTVSLFAEDKKARGFLINASRNEADCEYMDLRDIMYMIELFRQHAPGVYMKNTQIENFHWVGDAAHVELSCL